MARTRTYFFLFSPCPPTTAPGSLPIVSFACRTVEGHRCCTPLHIRAHLHAGARTRAIAAFLPNFSQACRPCRYARAEGPRRSLRSHLRTRHPRTTPLLPHAPPPDALRCTAPSDGQSIWSDLEKNNVLLVLNTIFIAGMRSSGTALLASSRGSRSAQPTTSPRWPPTSPPAMPASKTSASFPDGVTPLYVPSITWKALKHFFGGGMGIFTTQTLLSSVGFSQSKATPGAVAINWILKDAVQVFEGFPRRGFLIHLSCTLQVLNLKRIWGTFLQVNALLLRSTHNSLAASDLLAIKTTKLNFYAWLDHLKKLKADHGKLQLGNIAMDMVCIDQLIMDNVVPCQG